MSGRIVCFGNWGWTFLQLIFNCTGHFILQVFNVYTRFLNSVTFFTDVGKTSFVIVYNPDRMADELATVSPTVGATFATFRVPFGNTIVRMQVCAKFHCHLHYTYYFFCVFIQPGLGYCWPGEISINGPPVLQKGKCCSHNV